MNALFHPLGKCFSYDRVDHIRNVRPRQLQDLLVGQGQRSHDLGVLLSKGQHVVDREAFVLWHSDHLDIRALDQPSSFGYDVSHVKDGGRVIGAEVAAAFAGQESPDLSFSSVLSPKGEWVDFFQL